MASSKYPLIVGHKTIAAGWPNQIPTEEAREFRVRGVWNGVWPKIQLAKKIFSLTVYTLLTPLQNATLILGFMSLWFYFSRPITLVFHDLTTTSPPFSPLHVKSLLGLSLKYCPTPRYTTKRKHSTENNLET